MKTIKNIESYLPVFPGFYESIFQADETPSIEDGKNYDDYNWDYAKYNQSVCIECCDAIEIKLNELGFPVKIDFQELSSPRYYNYSNDVINVAYKIKTGFISMLRWYINANFEAFTGFIKSRYSSYSGFISSYTNDAFTWLSYVNYTDLSTPHYLGNFLEFVLQNEAYESINLYWDTIDRHGLSVDGWLKEPETFTVNGIEYLGDETELYTTYVSNPIDSEYNTIDFAEWLTINGDPITAPVLVDPSQLSLF
jgi:hypothetical protein